MINKTILVTGGTGFIGSHMVEYILEKTNYNIILLGRHFDNTIKSDRISKIVCDLKEPISRTTSDIIGDIDYVIHLAAKTLVDDSITHPFKFIYTNTIGTTNLLDFIRKDKNPEMIINYGTDEVYGPALEDYDFKEDDRWRPSSPYSASKCCQMAIGIAYARTYGLPMVHTYTMNIFGERQSNDKLIPIAIRKLLNKKPMTIHCKLENGKPTEIGSRMWLYAKSTADATLFLLKNAKINEHYNINGDIELTNLEIVNRIADILNVKDYDLDYVDFHKTRPGHDRRYSLDGSKIKNMGWKSPFDFNESLKKSVKWYVDNEDKLYK